MASLISSYIETANRALSMALSAGLNRAGRPRVDVSIALNDPSKPNGVKTQEIITVAYAQPVAAQGLIWLNADDATPTFKSFYVCNNGAYSLIGSTALVPNPENTIPVAPVGSIASANISDASVIGKNVLKAADAPTARTSISAVGFDSTSKLLDSNSKASLNLTGLSVPGVVNGTSYAIDWTGATDTSTPTQTWSVAANALAGTILTANSVASRIRIEVPAGSVIKLGSQITINGSNVEVDFKGSTVIFTNASSAGFVVTGTEFDTGPRYGIYHQNKPAISNAIIYGPGQSTATDGVLFLGDTTNSIEKTPASLGLVNVSISKFGNGVAYDRYCYLNYLTNCSIFQCTNGLATKSNFFGGERMTFTNCGFANCSTGVNLTTGTQTTTSDWFFTNCSIDYNFCQILSNHICGVHLMGCHVEHGANTTPAIVFTYGIATAGLTAINSNFLATGRNGAPNSFSSYLSLAGNSFFHATTCFFQSLAGVTNELTNNLNTPITVTGTVSVSPSTNALVGTGTTFTTALSVGDVVMFQTGNNAFYNGLNGTLLRATVIAIQSDTSATLDYVFPAAGNIKANNAVTAISGVTMLRFTSWSTAKTPAGTVAVSAGSVNVTGTGTTFTTSVAVGDFVVFTSGGGVTVNDASGAAVVAYVKSITSDTALVLDVPAPVGPSAPNITTSTLLAYTPNALSGRVYCRESLFPSNLSTNAVLPGGSTNNLIAYEATGSGTPWSNVQIAGNTANYPTKLVGQNLSLVSNNGYTEFRKTTSSATATVWIMVPIPPSARRNICFTFTDVGLGAIGTMHVLTRYGAYPAITQETASGVPDDAMYNTNFADYGSYTPSSIESTRSFLVPGNMDVPAWATHLVIKLDCTGLNAYSAATVVYKVRNFKVACW